jgi:hypothetical protein
MHPARAELLGNLCGLIRDLGLLIRAAAVNMSKEATRLAESSSGAVKLILMIGGSE